MRAGGLLVLTLGGLVGTLPIVSVSATGATSPATNAALPTKDVTSAAAVSPTISVSSSPSASALPAKPTVTAKTANSVAKPVPGAASIGVLATGSAVQSHSCTAAVVASSSGNVIVTAAHCISGSGAGIVFAPGYRDGTAPYGTWEVRAAYVDPAWLTNQDPDDDVAFLVVAPSPSNPKPVAVQDAVGGFEVGVAPVAGTAVRVTGYVSGADDSVVCTAEVYTTSGYPSFDCAGFAGGTSGGPWVTAGPNNTASITAVIGGPHDGGCDPATSYSSPFTTTTAALLIRAASNAAGDTLPEPDGDGC